MKYAFLAVIMMGVAANAMAADKTDGKSETYAVEKVICSKAYVPASGIASPDYQAGITVDGKSVAPANVSAPTSLSQADYIEVPMTIDLAKRMNLPQVGAEAEMPVANLKIYNNGKVEYNGQDISSNAGVMCGDTPAAKAPMSAVTEPVAAPLTPEIHDDAPMTMSARGFNDVIPAAGEDVTPKFENREPPMAATVVRSTTSYPMKKEYKMPEGVAIK